MCSSPGRDRQLWHAWSVGGQNWSGWEPLGGRLTSAPDGAAWAPNRLDVAGRGQDGSVWHLAWAGGWLPWEWLGGQVIGGQAAVSPAPNQLDVIARGSDDRVFIRSWFGSGWSPWSPLNGGATGFDPDATTAGGRTVVYARAGNALTYVSVRSSPTAPYGGWAWLVP